MESFFKRPKSVAASGGLPDAKVRKLEVDALPGLTEEQRKQIERNRIEALGRLNRNRTFAPVQSEKVAFVSIAGTTTTPKMEQLLDDSWKPVLKNYLNTPHFRDLDAWVSQQRKTKNVFPPEANVFNAFGAAKFDDVKVVIIGQDPYHGDGQAHGLCFSVQRGVARPPSLLNIFKELQKDIPGFAIPKHGSLQSWADQGVLLLNSVLTVEAYKAGSHANKGWEKFTDEVISQISSRKKNVVFLLWGRYAENKGKRIDRKKHHVLVASHPSPLAVSRGGWFGCKHFSKANELLKKSGLSPVQWNLPQ
eukprot:CAMPEP_0184737640 /NCGR_PEP_ID=MMETSP0315-20130426/422_1 /TAXON_ID=101924 /ORGANISM="Rhodosorus marinus, Strain UTEX LB 2760" /LENGTH=305 /DNA_ID=CAMNT_0027204939 /DNA_START=324 /DNA_END=1241 /DNA_ORIENTATION=-